MAKKESNKKNYNARNAWMERKKQGRLMQRWDDKTSSWIHYPYTALLP